MAQRKTRTRTQPRSRGPLRRGTRLGKYRLDRRLGQGAFAEVWRARDTVEKRDVALKITHPSAVTAWGRDPIEREARIASRLVHPHIVTVRNADWLEGFFVLVSDLAMTNLAEYPKARRSPRVALDIVRQIASGLAYAHEHRVLHRDVKPENILIFSDGSAGLGDFGASLFTTGATRTYTEAGTLGYMAPEQAYGRPSFTSDVFSLGIIAYEVLTGVRPSWPFEWPPEGIERFEARVPEPVGRVLRRAAEFNPRRRYLSGVKLHEALEVALGQAERERPRTPRRRPRRRPPQSPLQVQSQHFRRHYGAALEMRYRCHRCDGPIAESMSYCPWCGTSGNSFREITRYPLVCPECERGVRAEWKACPWCYAGRFEGNGRLPARDPKATRTCGARGCSGRLRPFMRYCPICKRKTRRPWIVPELPDRCPRCRWSDSLQFWRFCPWCGRRHAPTGDFARPGG
jgi:serine/threonine-protein kinase